MPYLCMRSQLGSRFIRSISASAAKSASPRLDFLYPLSTLTTPSPAPIGAPPPPVHSIAGVRSFSQTSCRRKTVCTLNPSTDDEGKPMHLDITPRAATRLAKIIQKDGKPGLALRVQVESGGCHGFQYLMGLVDLPERSAPTWPEVVRDDDVVFEWVDEGTDSIHAEANLQGPKIILDQPSLDLLKDSKVDYTTELIGSQFKIVDNPHATSSCGCGTSFDVKF